LSDRTLHSNFLAADRRLGLLRTFKNLRSASKERLKFRRNTLLIFQFDVEDESERLLMKSFDNVNRAIEAYDELEKEYGEKADIVLVRGESEENIRDAFRNYFSDSRAFVDFIEKGLQELEPAFPK